MAVIVSGRQCRTLVCWRRALWAESRNLRHSSLVMGPRDEPSDRSRNVAWRRDPASRSERDLLTVQRALRLSSRSAAARLAVQVLARQVRRGRQFHLVEEDWTS
jgi:hypothetical protein